MKSATYETAVVLACLGFFNMIIGISVSDLFTTIAWLIVSVINIQIIKL